MNDLDGDGLAHPPPGMPVRRASQTGALLPHRGGQAWRRAWRVSRAGSRAGV